MHSTKLLGDFGHVESRFFPFGDSVSVGERLVHGLRWMYHRLRNRFGHTRSYPRRRGPSESSLRLEIVLILMQDRCMVCVERTIGSYIILDAPDGTPR